MRRATPPGTGLHGLGRNGEASRRCCDQLRPPPSSPLQAIKRAEPSSPKGLCAPALILPSVGAETWRVHNVRNKLAVIAQRRMHHAETPGRQDRYVRSTDITSLRRTAVVMRRLHIAAGMATAVADADRIVPRRQEIADALLLSAKSGLKRGPDHLMYRASLARPGRKPILVSLWWSARVLPHNHMTRTQQQQHHHNTRATP